MPAGYTHEAVWITLIFIACALYIVETGLPYHQTEAHKWMHRAIIIYTFFWGAFWIAEIGEVSFLDVPVAEKAQMRFDAPIAVLIAAIGLFYLYRYYWPKEPNFKPNTELAWILGTAALFFLSLGSYTSLLFLGVLRASANRLLEQILLTIVTIAPDYLAFEPRTASAIAIIFSCAISIIAGIAFAIAARKVANRDTLTPTLGPPSPALLYELSAVLNERDRKSGNSAIGNAGVNKPFGNPNDDDDTIIGR